MVFRKIIGCKWTLRKKQKFDKNLDLDSINKEEVEDEKDIEFIDRS